MQSRFSKATGKGAVSRIWKKIKKKLATGEALVDVG
jgi:hypothetical protein